MKKHFLKKALAAALAVGAVAGCQKDNPRTVPLPAEPFTLSLTEQRDTRTFHWSVTREEGTGRYLTDNGEESIKSLHVTAYNSVTLHATADVNVEAVNASVVSVSRVGEGLREYSLTYKGDGLTSIRVWNGEGETLCEQVFTVVGRECIEVTGLRILWYECDKSVLSEAEYGHWNLDNEWVYQARTEKRYLTFRDREIVVSHSRTTPVAGLGNREMGNVVSEEDIPFGYDCVFYRSYYDGEKKDWLNNEYSGHAVTFLGFEPENCSFRTVLSFESEYNMWEMYDRMVAHGVFEGHEADREASRRMPGYPRMDPSEYAWLNSPAVNSDVSELVGMKAFLSGNYYAGTGFYLAVVGVNSKDGPRYFWIGHTEDKGLDESPD